MRLWRVIGALVVACSTATVAAQERVSLSEIVPALEGTELGAIDLGPAPSPGATRVVRRSEIVAALQAAGRNSQGLAIPTTTRIRRESVHLSSEEIAERARRAVARSIEPCQVQSLQVRSDATLPSGAIEFHSEGPERPTGRHVLITIVMSALGRSVRVPAQAEVSCPEPVVRAGGRVRVSIALGNVHASADGIARQPGRVGDTIRVHIEATHAQVEARILDEHHVEIVR